MYEYEKQSARSQENNSENEPGFKEKLKELSEYLSTMAKDLNEQEIPVDKDCRLNMDSFSDIYGDGNIEKDKEYVKELDNEFEAENNGNREKINNNNKLDGEKMEMLKTAIFNKKLGPDYIVVRTSKFDDYANKVDNIILNRKTDAVICAFDDVMPIDKDALKDKVRITLNRNKTKNGATIKYGVRVDTDSKKIVLSSMNNIPIFYLALGPDILKEGIEKFGDNKKEKELFKRFIFEINSQIGKIESEFSNINPEFKKHFNDFKKFIESIPKKIIYSNGTNEKP